MPDTAYDDEGTLADALATYRARPHDPAVVTDTFQQIWRVRGARLGRNIDVPPCPYTADELAALDRDGWRPSYLPPSLATQSSRPQLGATFPAMDDFSLLADNSVVNDVDHAGWFDCDASIESPLQQVNEAELFELLAERGQVLLTLNQYIVASQDSRLIAGHYFDEAEAWARISSRSNDRLMVGRFDGKEPVGWNTTEVHVEGCLIVGYDVGPKDKGVMGARPSRSWSEVAPPGPQVFDKPLPAPPNVTDLDAEWERQVDKYVQLGFHEQLSMSASEYKDSLPRFSPQPAAYRGRFDVPLVVDTRIHWEEQAAAAGIRKSSFMYIPFEPVDERHRMLDQPYSAWFTAWGQGFREPIAPAAAHAQLADDEFGANPNDLMAMEIAYPELNADGRYWEAIGYCLPPQAIIALSSDSSFIRYVSNWRPRGVPEVACNLNPFVYTFFRPLVRGAEITHRT